jgi:hypothetical protein
MYDLVDRPFENDSIREDVSAITEAQERATVMGGYLVSEYANHFLPKLESLEGVSRRGTRPSGNDLLYGWDCSFGTLKPLPGSPYGCAVLIPFPGAELPQALQEEKLWTAAEAVLDYSTRTISVQAGDSLITFSSVNPAIASYTLLRDINEALVERNAGVLVWRLSGKVGNPAIQHLYEDGRVPIARNEHAQATVTGSATTSDHWNTSLVYIGLVAHKTALESLHATLLQRKALSLDGTSVLPDGHFRMESVPLPDFGLYHAGLICDGALPGQWSSQDESAYALVFKRPGMAAVEIEPLLEAAVVARLREVLPHPVKEEWAHVLFDEASDRGLIDRLNVGGDCLAGARIHLEKDWTALMNDLLETKDLIV